MKQYFLHFNKWECYKSGFYKKSESNETRIKESIKLLSNEKLCNDYFSKVISLWPNSCMHFLTDYSSNCRSYIGRAACFISHNSTIEETTIAWNKLNNLQQCKANKIADSIINNFRIKLNTNQLCLRFI